MRAKLHHPKSAPKVHLCTLIAHLAASIIALITLHYMGPVLPLDCMGTGAK